MISIILPYYNRKKYIIPTLDSFEYLYKNNELEIVIVDDCSNDENRLEDILNKYKLNIKYIRLENKTGINPCYINNVGVRQSSGDIILLTSPEIFHTNNIFEISNNFKELTDTSYLLFSVFCLTEKKLLNECLDDKINIEQKILGIKNNIPNFYKDLGINGYSFNNNYGSWYLHSEIRPSYLNFCTVLTRNLYYELSGFDERFRNGTEYDDNEFLDRLKEKVKNYIWYDDFISIHIDHPISSTNFNKISNNYLYQKTKIDKYLKNNDWGKI